MTFESAPRRLLILALLIFALAQGEKGEQGDKGINGKIGLDGRDGMIQGYALQIFVLMD